ncbi:transposable element Tcb1 transposase [Trichonephila clavipes]|nr:transposable element Tcb1 transposase [Trichonephila clavipes]
MEYPAYSPDRNPVENLCDALGHALRKRFPSPATFRDFEIAVEGKWGLLDSAVVDPLVTNLITLYILYEGNRRVIIRGDAFGCKTQFIVRVLSSALGGIRALTRKSESGKERERKRGVAFVENLTHAQIALKVLARVSTARNCSRFCARTDRNEKLMRS